MSVFVKFVEDNMSLVKGEIIRVEEANWNQIKIDTTSPKSRYNVNTVTENYQSVSGLFRIELKDQNQGILNESDTEVGITNSWLSSCESFGASLYAGSILFASIAVECVLNHDMRLDTERKNARDEWLTLNIKNLKTAYNKSFPTNLLLKSNETFQTNTIEFVNRRNKVAHGDTEGYAKTQFGSFTAKSYSSISHTTVSWQPTKEHALEQIEKSKKFIIAWASSIPHPILRIH